METDKSMPNGEIILYQPDSSIRLEVRMKEDTVWLTQAQMAALFGVDRTVIVKHIGNIFKTKELDEVSTCAKIAQLQQEGNRHVLREVKYYNLDMIISVGFRVNSINATRFRQWATSVLKEYLLRGHAINQRIERLEQRVNKTEEQIGFFVRTALPPVEGVFFDGQIFDAYAFAAGLIRSVPPSKTWGRSCSRSAGWGFQRTRCCRKATEAVSVACLRHAVPHRPPTPHCGCRLVWGY